MKVLLDTNVLLDALLRREPWGIPASALWRAIDRREIIGCVTSSSLTDIYYLSRIHIKRSGVIALDARQIIRRCLDSLFVIGVGRDDLERAYLLGGPDFEDDLQVACATRLGLDAIVTRDRAGFVRSAVPVVSTQELVDRLALGEPQPTSPVEPTSGTVTSPDPEPTE